jgi:hypothetical protein
VAVLAEKYGFDADEANRLLSTDDLKIVRKRGPAVSPKAEKPNKADKASKADKPKRAKTGYLLYADEVRAEVKESLIAELEDGEKLKPQDVVKAIAARWGEEDAETKEEWKSKAKTPTTSDDEQEVAELAVAVATPADEEEQDDDQEDDDEATEAAAKVAAKAEEAKAKKEAKAQAKKDAKAQAKKDAE